MTTRAKTDYRGFRDDCIDGHPGTTWEALCTLHGFISVQSWATRHQQVFMSSRKICFWALKPERCSTKWRAILKLSRAMRSDGFFKNTLIKVSFAGSMHNLWPFGACLDNMIFGYVYFKYPWKSYQRDSTVVGNHRSGTIYERAHRPMHARKNWIIFSII